MHRFIYRTYDDKGKCTPIGGAHKSAHLRTRNLQKPARLYWDMTLKLTEIVENAVKFAQKVCYSNTIDTNRPVLIITVNNRYFSSVALLVK